MSPPDRLSALDAAFLDLESATVPFVIGSILRFDRRIDLEELRAHVDAALDGLPRYRQRLGRIPLLHHPMWIDDPTFTIARHVLAVPAELASSSSVEETAADLLSRLLPREHPPWQLWLVDSGEGTSAIIAVIHHALVDGIAGVHLLERVLSGVPDQVLARSRRPPPESRPPPRRRLLADELRHRAHNLGRIKSDLSTRPLRVAAALGDLLWQGLHPASSIGLNPRRVGGERTIATCSLALDAVKRVRRARGVTLNDVVLAITTGALRELLIRRGVDVARADDVRAMVPVSTLPRGEDAISGNKVALLLTPLAVDEPDPVRRLARVAAATSVLKGQSGQREAGELLVRLSDATSPTLLSAVLRLALATRGFNVVITNIPGPPFPLYLMGARLDSLTPIVNLWPHGALGVAVMSYAGRLAIGLNADRAVIPDLKPMARDLVSCFEELARTTGSDAR